MDIKDFAENLIYFVLRKWQVSVKSIAAYNDAE